MTDMRLNGSPVPAPDQEAGPRPRVAVLGTGTMGSAMARNLLQAGLPIDVWNRTQDPAARLTEAGATAYPRARQAVAQADVVITMLPDAAAVTSVAFDQGMVDALGEGAIWAQMGTIGVQATSQLAARVADRRPDVRFVDAPVSGTRGPAEAGQLLILASGPDAARSPLTPVFGAIGSRALWLGEAGQGSKLKLVLNTWLAFLVEGIAETAALAGSLGVDGQALRAALDGGPLGAPAALAKLAKIEAADDEPDFALRWALKDVDLAVAAAGDRTPAGRGRDRSQVAWAGQRGPGRGRRECRPARARPAGHGRLSVTLAARRWPAVPGTRRSK